MKMKLLIFCWLLNASLFAKETPIGVVADNELAEQTNLVLRQIGHQLLTIEGNDSVPVAPIQQIEAHIFLLPLAQSFYYDTLPQMLHTALADFEMEKESYYVTVKDCRADSVILGYDARQFLAGKVACIGRHQYVACNHIYLTFPNRKQTALKSNYAWAYVLIFPFLLGIYFYYQKSKISPKPMPPSSVLGSGDDFLYFGQSKLDVGNQKLIIEEVEKNLTFRETKLLQYFANHANQLLKREDLLENVWGDEGVLVGRSLDVFVSRLRKLLKADSSLQIKTVHGVGYRLEV